MLKILLVDDEATERDGIQFLIQKFAMPFEVAEAANGREAFEYIKSHEIDILLTDVKMPYMDGLELAKAVNQYNDSITIIIFSAYSEFEYAKKACEANAVNYLLKPIEIDEFKDVMLKVIDICNSKKSWKEQKKLLQIADKKLLLYKMLTSKDSIVELAEKLKEYHIVLDNKYMTLFHLETLSNYFEYEDDNFDQIIKKYSKYKFEYINMYPNSAYILFYSRNKMEEQSIVRLSKQIFKELTQYSRVKVSIIVGKCFKDTVYIPSAVNDIEKIRESTFSSFSEIFYAYETSEFNGSQYEKSAIVREAIFQCIESRNIQAAKEQIELYVKYLKEDKATSIIYTKHVFIEILKSIYNKFNLYNQNARYPIIEKIMECTQIDEIKNIYLLILTDIEKENKQSVQDVGGSVAHVKRIIQNKYKDDLSLDELAEQVCLTPAYLSYMFKQETGSNLIRYITDFRMNKAALLLEQGQMKIIDIGKDCGYQNPSYFNRIFKNYFGITPKQYREKTDDK